MIDDSVWLVDSNYPVRNTLCQNFKFNKILLVVRDPFETILENLHTEVTQTLTQKCEISSSHSQWVEKFVNLQIAQLEKYWDHIMKEFRTRNVPVYYIKYEDLV